MLFCCVGRLFGHHFIAGELLAPGNRLQVCRCNRIKIATFVMRRICFLGAKRRNFPAWLGEKGCISGPPSHPSRSHDRGPSGFRGGTGDGPTGLGMSIHYGTPRTLSCKCRDAARGGRSRCESGGPELSPWPWRTRPGHGRSADGEMTSGRRASHRRRQGGC